MNQQPDQLSKLLLEADGLLLLLHRHREETPLDAIKILRKKLQLILALTEGLDELIEETENTAGQAVAENTDDKPTSDDDAHEEDSAVSGNAVITTENKDDTEENISPEDNNCQDTFYDNNETDEAPAGDTHTDSPQPDNAADYIEDNIEDQMPVNSTPVFVEEPSQPIFMDDDDSSQALSMNNTTETAENTFVDDTPLPEPETTGYHRTYIINEATPVKESHIQPRRPISTVFNLNDKFRFRRELFGNSDAQYVECLDMLSAMKSLDEAKEYLFEDLSWNPDNDDAQAFIELLANYYQ